MYKLQSQLTLSGAAKPYGWQSIVYPLLQDLNSSCCSVISTDHVSCTHVCICMRVPQMHSNPGRSVGFKANKTK